MIRRLTPVMLFAGSLLFVQCTRAPARPGPSIEGTYRLAYRELPDGTRQVPPAVDGLMTFAGGYRSVNIMEHNPGMDVVTLSSVGTYTLTDSVYTEHQRYHMGTGLADSAGGGLRTNLDGSSPVTVGANQSIAFNMPLDGPHVIFTGDSMTARLGSVLTDHWVKVKSVK